MIFQILQTLQTLLWFGNLTRRPPTLPIYFACIIYFGGDQSPIKLLFRAAWCIVIQWLPLEEDIGQFGDYGRCIIGKIDENLFHKNVGKNFLNVDHKLLNSVWKRCMEWNWIVAPPNLTFPISLFHSTSAWKTVAAATVVHAEYSCSWKGDVWSKPQCGTWGIAALRTWYIP